MDMKDVPAPFSSMTRELIGALNITNLVEATSWSTNGALVDGQGVEAVDDPTVDSFNSVYVFYPTNAVGSVSYKTKFLNHDVEFRLNIRNLFAGKAVIYQDTGITLRPPGGNLNVPYRVATPSRIADYQQPISFLPTTRVEL